MRRQEIVDRDRLLVKYLLGETSPEESEDIEGWVSSHPAHREYANEFRKIWEQSRRLAPAEPLDPAAAWQRFLDSGKLTAPSAGVRMTSIHSAGTWLKIAASIILIAVGTYTWWKLDVQPEPLLLQSGAATRTDTLPGGSRVTLNKFSTLTGSKASRAVRLSGEAFFEITHDAHHPFTVQVHDITIRDVGTGFNVRSTDSTTEIIVESGAILVTAGSDTIQATAGEKVVVTTGPDAAKTVAGKTTITKTPVSSRLYQYYRTKSFICHSTPLGELITVLNEAYGVHITVQKEEISRLQMTATFDNEDLDSILTVITRTFGLNIQKKGGSILLKQP